MDQTKPNQKPSTQKSKKKATELSINQNPNLPMQATQSQEKYLKSTQILKNSNRTDSPNLIATTKWKRQFEEMLNSDVNQDKELFGIDNTSEDSTLPPMDSDTDATRVDDIVISLDENTFYDLKVLNFPFLVPSLPIVNNYNRRTSHRSSSLTIISGTTKFRMKSLDLNTTQRSMFNNNNLVVKGSYVSENGNLGKILSAALIYKRRAETQQRPSDHRSNRIHNMEPQVKHSINREQEKDVNDERNFRWTCDSTYLLHSSADDLFDWDSWSEDCWCRPSKPLVWDTSDADELSNRYISPSEAHRRLSNLLTEGTRKNLRALHCDEYNNIRNDGSVASSEEEFISSDEMDVEENWISLQSEFHKELSNILRKLNPYDQEYERTVDDLLHKYLKYFIDKRRNATRKRIFETVQLPNTQREKTILLINAEFDDKRLINENIRNGCCHSPLECIRCGKRKRAITRKYMKCETDPDFCHRYFHRSIEHASRAIKNLTEKIAKLKKELNL